MRDSGGNPISTAEVTFRFTGNGGKGSLLKWFNLLRKNNLRKLPNSPGGTATISFPIRHTRFSRYEPFYISRSDYRRSGKLLNVLVGGCKGKCPKDDNCSADRERCSDHDCEHEHKNFLHCKCGSKFTFHDDDKACDEDDNCRWEYYEEQTQHLQLADILVSFNTWEQLQVSCCLGGFWDGARECTDRYMNLEINDEHVLAFKRFVLTHDYDSDLQRFIPREYCIPEASKMQKKEFKNLPGTVHPDYDSLVEAYCQDNMSDDEYKDLGKAKAEDWRPNPLEFIGQSKAREELDRAILYVCTDISGNCPKYQTFRQSGNEFPFTFLPVTIASDYGEERSHDFTQAYTVADEWLTAYSKSVNREDKASRALWKVLSFFQDKCNTHKYAVRSWKQLQISCCLGGFWDVYKYRAPGNSSEYEGFCEGPIGSTKPLLPHRKEECNGDGHSGQWKRFKVWQFFKRFGVKRDAVIAFKNFVLTHDYVPVDDPDELSRREQDGEVPFDFVKRSKLELILIPSEDQKKVFRNLPGPPEE